MAVSTSSRLICKFKDDEGEAVNKSFNYAKADVTGAQAKALMAAMVANGENVFNKVPAEAVSAQVVTTTTTDLDIA